MILSLAMTVEARDRQEPPCGMRHPDPGSRIPDPGSRIPDPRYRQELPTSVGV